MATPLAYQNLRSPDPHFKVFGPVPAHLGKNGLRKFIFFPSETRLLSIFHTPLRQFSHGQAVTHRAQAVGHLHDQAAIRDWSAGGRVGIPLVIDIKRSVRIF